MEQKQSSKKTATAKDFYKSVTVCAEVLWQEISVVLLRTIHLAIPGGSERLNHCVRVTQQNPGHRTKKPASDLALTSAVGLLDGYNLKDTC